MHIMCVLFVLTWCIIIVHVVMIYTHDLATTACKQVSYFTEYFYSKNIWHKWTAICFCFLIILGLKYYLIMYIFGCFEYVGTIGTQKLGTVNTAQGSAMLHWTMSNDPGSCNLLCKVRK